MLCHAPPRPSTGLTEMNETQLLPSAQERDQCIGDSNPVWWGYVLACCGCLRQGWNLIPICNPQLKYTCFTFHILLYIVYTVLNTHSLYQPIKFNFLIEEFLGHLLLLIAIIFNFVTLFHLALSIFLFLLSFLMLFAFFCVIFSFYSFVSHRIY